MKLYTHKFALSPRRVHLYLGEKKLDVPTVDVDVAGGANRAPAFLAKNPAGRVPVLELDDGRTLTESDAIIEYLEELHPEPPLLGRDAWQRAKTREAERVVELGMLVPLYTIFKHTHESYAGKLQQAPDVVPSQREQFYEWAAVVDGWLAERRFVAGEALTLADLTLLMAVDICAFVGCAIDGAKLPHLTRWIAQMHARPGVNRGWEG
ncbi:MAG: glutathione S-transferase family protein [bacterium]|nr:glutathione S-transferase family protein [bacterium]